MSGIVTILSTDRISDSRAVLNANFAYLDAKGLVDDATPQLGGDLDLNGHLIGGALSVVGGNVGIGTTEPSTLLHLSSAVGADIGLKVERALVATAIYGANYFGTFSNSDISLYTNSLPRITVAAAGNVGIGTTEPGQLLTVRNGAIMTTGSAINTDRLMIDTDGVNTWHLRHTNDNLDSLVFGNDYGGTFATKVLTLSRVGNVGICKTNPGSKLAVVGLPSYADNAAAITGGLTAGDFYRTGGDPDLVAVVH